MQIVRQQLIEHHYFWRGQAIAAGERYDEPAASASPLMS